jgi:hypothetical protein
VTVPHVAPAQPSPVMLQVTAALLLPVTAALNCCWAPVFNSTLAGETVTLTCALDEIVTVVDPDIDRFDRDLAVTTTVAGLGAVAGAV